jgi:probable F420-dependent oxidoreductase
VSRLSFGVLFPFVDGLITSGPFLADFLAVVEASGADSVWSVEHVVVAEDYEPLYPYSADGHMPSGPGVVTPMPDPIELLAFAAARTERLLLATSVVVAPLHPPAVLAKRAATVDLLSGGRLLLGLGIGWQKEEYAAVGVPYRQRGARLEECIGALRALWAGGPATFHGHFVDFDRVHLAPAPARPAIPIVLGGNTEAAVDRAGRLAEGWYPYTLDPDQFAAAAGRLRAASAAAGRAPDAVEITAWPGSADPARELDPDWVGRYVAAGASRLIVAPRVRRPDQLDRLAAQLERYRTEVVEPLAAQSGATEPLA